eukprot:gene27060-56494_t
MSGAALLRRSGASPPRGEQPAAKRRRPEGLEVYIEPDDTGATELRVITVEVPRDGTVGDLRRAAGAALGWCLWDYDLHFGGEVLRDDSAALADAGLSREARHFTAGAGARSTPIPDLRGRRAVAVTAGFNHSLAMLNDGDVVAW